MGNFDSCSDVFGMILLLLHDHYAALQTLLLFPLHADLSIYLIMCIPLHFINALVLCVILCARCPGQFASDSTFCERVHSVLVAFKRLMSLGTATVRVPVCSCPIHDIEY